jgi:hypothetical protein
MDERMLVAVSTMNRLALIAVPPMGAGIHEAKRSPIQFAEHEGDGRTPGRAAMIRRLAIGAWLALDFGLYAVSIVTAGFG